jgi:hypothetical protein
MNRNSTNEYINEFMYFIFMPGKGGIKNTLIYCSGVNLFRFLPITKGRHRPLSNPVRRGLQLVNLGVRSLALSKDATPKATKEDVCAGIAPLEDGWYRDLLLIENATESLPEEIINYSVINLLKKISNATTLNFPVPDNLLTPEELTLFIEDLCRKYSS